MIGDYLVKIEIREKAGQRTYRRLENNFLRVENDLEYLFSGFELDRLIEFLEGLRK